MTDLTDAAIDCYVADAKFYGWYDAADAITALRAERDAALALAASEYARGIEDAARVVRSSADLYASKDANFICHNASLDIEVLASAPPAPVVGVKPLVWVKHPAADVWRCDTLIGTYKVFGVKPLASWDFDGLDNEGVSLSTSKMAQNVSAAFTAAQADYEARIRSCLIDAPQGLPLHGGD